MVEVRNHGLALLFRREAILIIFLLAKTVNSVITGMTLDTNEAWGFGILALLVYSILSWFTYRRQVISTWAISVIMLYEVSGPLARSVKSLLAAPLDDPVRSTLTLVVTGYLICGALGIFKSRHQCE